MTEPRNLIYGLIDPRTGVIRYVGQSTRGLARPKEHWRHTMADDKSHRANWIRVLKRAGTRYEIVVLQYLRDDQPYEDIDAVECWWVAYGRAQGWNLTNTTDGGAGVHGYVPSEESRRRAAQASREYWADPAHRKIQSAHQRGRRRSTETRRKIGDAHRGIRRPDVSAWNRARRGWTQSDEAKAACSLRMKGNTYGKALKGLKRSWVTNYRVSLAQRRRHQGPLIRINLLPKSEP